MCANTNKIKLVFSAMCLFLMAGMVAGGFLIVDNYLFSANHFLQVASSLKYRLVFAKDSNENFIANIFSFIVSGNYFANQDQDSAQAQSIPVLLYHGVLGDSEKVDSFNVSKISFYEQMSALKKAGWQTISLDDFHKFIKGEKQLKEKSFLLTFDDGRRDSFYPVDPVLRALGYNAVIFIITGQTQEKSNKNYLSWPELRYMAKTGRWEIQSHGNDDHGFIAVDANGRKGYFLTNKMWLANEQRLETEEEFKQRITNDLSVAKNILDKVLKQNTIGFAFPMGDYGFESVNLPEADKIILPIVKEIYPLSFYQTWYGNGFSSSYPNVLRGEEQSIFKRIEAQFDWTATSLLFALEEGSDRPLPFADDFQARNGWSHTWGLMDWQNSFLKISASASSTGAAVFLDGSYLWQDYDFKAKINFAQGAVFSLLGRYQANESYISCNFNPKRATLQERINGEEKILAQWSDFAGERLWGEGNDIDVSLQVVGQEAKCLIDGRVILSFSDVSGLLNRGGVGFKVWDRELDNASLIIKNVQVASLK